MKHIFALLALSTLSASFAQADLSLQPNKKTGIQMSDQEERTVDDKYGRFQKGPFLTADFLYWIAHEEGLEYAMTGAYGDTNVNNNISVSEGSSKNVDFKWKPGFRLGAGWTFSDNYWDASINWTWYSTRAKDSASHTGDPNLNPLWPSLAPASLANVIETPLTLDRASANWRLLYNTLDVELGRSFYPTKCLSLKPHAGVRGAWVNQSYSLHYNFDANSTTFSTIKRKLRNNYHAAGFKAGLDTFWSFNSAWGLFANGSISLLGGNFHLRQIDDVTSITTSSASFTGNFLYVNLKDRFFSVIPVFEGSMGIQLTLKPSQKNYWFDLSAGWEYLLWMNQNQIGINTTNNIKGLFIRQHDNLHLMGFTLHAKVHF
ncbi:MAG: Lpg1974 family pore-forming outer membrane protein [Chlamydiales bacterium]